MTWIDNVFAKLLRMPGSLCIWIISSSLFLIFVRRSFSFSGAVAPLCLPALILLRRLFFSPFSLFSLTFSDSAGLPWIIPSFFLFTHLSFTISSSCLFSPPPSPPSLPPSLALHQQLLFIFIQHLPLPAALAVDECCSTGDKNYSQNSCSLSVYSNSISKFEIGIALLDRALRLNYYANTAGSAKHIVS